MRTHSNFPNIRGRIQAQIKRALTTRVLRTWTPNIWKNQFGYQGCWTQDGRRQRESHWPALSFSTKQGPWEIAWIPNEPCRNSLKEHRKIPNTLDPNKSSFSTAPQARLSILFQVASQPSHKSSFSTAPQARLSILFQVASQPSRPTLGALGTGVCLESAIPQNVIRNSLNICNLFPLIRNVPPSRNIEPRKGFLY